MFDISQIPRVMFSIKVPICLYVILMVTWPSQIVKLNSVYKKADVSTGLVTVTNNKKLDNTHTEPIDKKRIANV